MKAKLEEVERPLRVPRSMPELELHELQVASLYGEEYRIAYEARVTEVARTLAEELYQDPDFGKRGKTPGTQVQHGLRTLPSLLFEPQISAVPGG